MKKKLSLLLAAVCLCLLLSMNYGVNAATPNLIEPTIKLPPAVTPALPAKPLVPLIPTVPADQPSVPESALKDIIDISDLEVKIPSDVPFLKLDDSVKLAYPGNLPGFQEKDMNIVFPADGDVLKNDQMYVVELKVNKTDNYDIYLNNNKLQNGFSFTEGSTILWPQYCKVDKETPMEFKVVRKSDNSVVDKTSYVIGESSMDSKIKILPGNNSIKLDWEAPDSLPGRVEYVIYRQKKGEKWIQATDFAIAENSYTDKNVKNGSTYMYQIGAKLVGSSYSMFWSYKQAGGTPFGKMILIVGNPNMTLNGESTEIDPGKGTSPVIVNGRTFVPIRAIIEALGGTVSWDGAAKKVTISCNKKIIELVIGSNNAIVSGTAVETDAAPYISDTGRTMLPLRFVIDNLGYDVTWEDATKTITIIYTSN